MNTIVYLIRHSVRLNNEYIENYNTSQNKNLKDEKVVLSVEGEKRAEILSNEEELQNLDTVYVSNCVRTLQTVKYIIEKQNLKVNIDERFDERKAGKEIKMQRKEWIKCQYLNEDFKTEGGESQKDVRERISEAFYEALEKHKGKRIAIFSHGYAITFFIMKWCKFEYVEEKDDLKFTFKDKEVFNGKINAPEVFKLEFGEENELIDINNIKFEDLPYKDGMGK